MRSRCGTHVFAALAMLSLTRAPCAAPVPATIDLTKAVVVTAGASADVIERQAALMLRWELQRRTRLDLPQVTALPAKEVPAIVVGSIERMPAGLTARTGAGGADDQRFRLRSRE